MHCDQSTMKYKQLHKPEERINLIIGGNIYRHLTKFPVKPELPTPPANPMLSSETVLQLRCLGLPAISYANEIHKKNYN